MLDTPWSSISCASLCPDMSRSRSPQPLPTNPTPTPTPTQASASASMLSIAQLTYICIFRLLSMSMRELPNPTDMVFWLNSIHLDFVLALTFTHSRVFWVPQSPSKIINLRSLVPSLAYIACLNSDRCPITHHEQQGQATADHG
jgi:hypothetical protein